MSGSYKSEKETHAVTSAICDGFMGLQELRDEMREVADNMENGNLGHTDKAQRCQEAADTLESYCDNEPDVPDDFSDLMVEVFIQRNRRKGRSESRAVRCSNACALLSAAADRIREWAEEKQEERNKIEDDANGNATPEAEALDEKISNAEDLAGELEDVVSNCEGVDFPGYYG